MDSKSHLPKMAKHGSLPRDMDLSAPSSNTSSEKNLSFADTRNMKDFDSSQTIALIKTHKLIETPKSDTDPGLLQHTRSVSSMFFDIKKEIHFDVEPLLSEASAEDFNSLFLRKCQQCLQICNFNSEEEQKTAKSQKTEILADILKVISIEENVARLTAAEYKSLYKMFSKNIIRITPPAPEFWFSLINTDLEVELVEEASWVHMSLIYDIMTIFFQSKNFNSNYCIEEVISLSRSIIDIFHSPDAREREKLIKLFHAMYKACGKQRNLLRKEIKTFLQVYMLNPYPIIGVNEVLNVAIPIISGYHVPLHQEHITFYKTTFLPLHRSDLALKFHCPLATALTIFCNKEPSLVFTFIIYIKTHWPKTKPAKQILFLSELESLLPLIPQHSMQESIIEIISLVSTCAQSQDYAVSERAMMMWQNEKFVNLVVSFSRVTYPILLPALFRTANEHWLNTVSTLAVYVLRALKESDANQFNEVGANMKVVESCRIMKEVERGKMWQSLVTEFGESEKMKEETLGVISKLFVGNDVAQNQNQNQNQKPKHVSSLRSSTKEKKIPIQAKPKIAATEGAPRLMPKLTQGRSSAHRQTYKTTAPSQSTNGKIIPKSLLSRPKRS